MSNDVTVRLRGDPRQLDKTLRHSEQSVAKYATAIKATIATIAGAFAIRKAFDFGTSMLALNAEQVKAELRLEAVLKATGNAAGWTADQMKAMASEMQEQIGVGDELILQTQAVIATFRNVRGDHFREATMAAYDMAAVLGTDAKSAALQLGKALNDPIAGTTALSRAGVQFTKQQKDLIEALQNSGDLMGAQRIILDELKNQMGGAAEAIAEADGGLTKMWNSLGDLGEQIGKALVPAVEVFVGVARNMIDITSRLVSSLTGSVSASDWVASSIDALSDTFKWFATVMADTFSFAEFVVTNFGTMVERETVKWMLAWTKMSETVKYYLTEVTPAYMKWFADNWARIIFDLYNFNRTVFNNMFKNVADFFKAVWSWLNGDGFDFEFTALTDGFEATTRKLPDIAKREIGGFEQVLTDELDRLDNKLGKSWNDIYKKNRDFIDGLFAPPETTADSVQGPNFDRNFDDMIREEEKKEKKKNERVEKEKRAEQEKTLAGQETGLEELAKSIQSTSLQSTLQSMEASQPFVFKGRQDSKQGDGGAVVVEQDKVVDAIAKQDTAQAERDRALVNAVNNLNVGVV